MDDLSGIVAFLCTTVICLFVYVMLSGILCISTDLLEKPNDCICKDISTDKNPDSKLVSPTLVNNNSNEFIKDVSAAVQVNDCTSEINNDTDIKKIKKKNDDDDLFYIGIFWF